MRPRGLRMASGIGVVWVRRMRGMQRILVIFVGTLFSGLILYPLGDQVRMEIPSRHTLVYPSPTPCAVPWHCGPRGWWDKGARYRCTDAGCYVAPPTDVLKEICDSARRQGLEPLRVKCWGPIDCRVLTSDRIHRAHWYPDGWAFSSDHYPWGPSRGEPCPGEVSRWK